ncbi:MAG: 16S rRNA (uracil(1498)-N(3))-methyltransferase [Lysobacteraceae bacterium]
MRTTRCHVDLPLTSGAHIDLPAATANHLLRVLRLRVGDAFALFNGDGRDYTATLVAQGRDGAQALVGEARKRDSESPLRSVLAQGVARGEKMDLILQKAVELGVSRIQPLWTERTEVRLDGPRLAKRLAHWQGVVVSACEQCGRAVLPTLDAPLTLEAFAASVRDQAALPLYLDPTATLGITQMTPPPAAGVLIAIGPEGGFSAAERARLHTAGFSGLRLGPRVLRTETAGLAALAALQARFGDLG